MNKKGMIIFKVFFFLIVFAFLYIFFFSKFLNVAINNVVATGNVNGFELFIVQNLGLIIIFCLIMAVIVMSFTGDGN